METRLGHYDIVEELGRGGMGVVYKGYEAALGRFVAIKVLSSAMAHDKVFVERFLREARAMATLNDSHIIQIYFIGQDEDQTFFVMEYVDGESLCNCLKRDAKLVVPDALKILLHAAQGLAAAHAQGVIHRDIKPGNIMIGTRGQVKLTDFGIALANHDVSSKLTTIGGFVGTPGYLSPEVCLGKAVDQRSDIFAMGIVLFEMLAGRTPFKADSPLKQMLDVVETPTPDIRELNADVQADVALVLEKMLAKEPADRYQSCEELISDLKQLPLLVEGAQLQLVPARWTGSTSSQPTQVGAPAPLTPGSGQRIASSPPIVSSRTPLQAPAAANANSVTRASRSRRKFNRLLLLATAALAMGVFGWLMGRSGTVENPLTASAQVPVPEVAASSAPASGALTAMPPPPPSPLVVSPTTETATAASPEAFGHGGEHTSRNRVRAIASDKTVVIAKQSASRKRNRGGDRDAGSARGSRPVAVANGSARPSKITRARKKFLCRVFRKCEDAPAGATPAGKR